MPTNLSSDLSFKILDEELGNFVFGHWHNIGICVWQQQATTEAVERLTNVIDSVRRLFPKGVSAIHIVGNHAGIPNADARSEFLRLIKRENSEIGCISILIVGSGFRASAISSIVAGIRLLAPMSISFRIFKSIEDLVAWLPQEHFKKTTVKVDPKQLEKVLKKTLQELLPQ